ncbi:MAG: glycoside hydrolase, partial [Sphingomonas sp.]
AATDPVGPIPDQTLAQDSADWPRGRIRVDLADYLVRPHQLWTITPVPAAGGYFGAPYYRIAIAGTSRMLAATPNGEVETITAATAGAEPLWQIDQLTDGSYRIKPKVVPGDGRDLALVAIGASTPTLAAFDPASPAGRWTFKRP